MLATSLLLTLLACGPSYYDIQQQDTIEAFEGWLATANTADANYYPAHFRLEELYLEKAREMKSLEGYDMYLAAYPVDKDPKPQLRTKALDEREEFLYNYADEADSPEAWQKFLDEYPKGNKKRKQEARRRLSVAEYRDNLSFGEIEITPVNLAEDPEGPMNGFAITCDITNKGDKKVTYLNMEIRYLNADGNTFEKERWPWVAPRFPVPIEEEFKVPVEPGETRQYYYTTEEPEGGKWARKVQLLPVSIQFDDGRGEEGKGEEEE